MIKRDETVDQENYIIPVKETDDTKKAKNLEKNIAKLQIFWQDYVKTNASMVIAKEILEVWYLAFLKFFLCVLNKFDKNNERKQTHKKQRKTNNKQKNFKEQHKNSRWHFSFDEVFNKYWRKYTSNRYSNNRNLSFENWLFVI